MPAMASAWAWVSAPGSVTGAMALASGGEVDQPLAHGDVELQRRIGVDHRVAVDAGLEGLGGDAVSETDHLEAVAHLALTPGVDEGHLVGEAELGQRHVEMAELDGDILRLD